MSYKLPAMENLIGRLESLPPVPVLSKISAAIRHVHREALLVHNIAPDETRSDSWNATVKTVAMDKQRAFVEKTHAEVNALTSAFRSEVAAARNLKANLVPDSFAQEVRQAVRAMSPEERLTYVHQAIQAGDAATVAALVSAPAVLTGLSSAQQADFKSAYLEKHAPANPADDVGALQAIVDTYMPLAVSLATPTAAKQGSTV